MNKSKFLKRSLAALLAILMVVAMVPASAFAAEPDIIKVNGVEVTRSGDAYSVSITAPNGTADVIENALKNARFELLSKNGTTVGIINKDGAQDTTSLAGLPGTSGTVQTVDLLANAVKPEDSYWGDYTGIKLQVTTYSADGTPSTIIYPLTISVSERSASKDTDILSVESTRIVSASVDNTAHTIVITKPIGRVSKYDVLGLTTSNVKLSSPNATASFVMEDEVKNGGDDEKIAKIIVTAEDKSTQEYTVSYVVEPIFTEFSVDKMIGKHTETEVNETGNVLVTVEVPYGTFAASDRVKPVFTPSADIKTLRAIDFSSSDNTSATNTTVDIYQRSTNQTTSNVAIWTGGDPDDPDSNGENQYEYELVAETERSTLAEDNTGEGTVTVKFVPKKNSEAKLTGVNVSTRIQTLDVGGNVIDNSGYSYNQGLIEIGSNVKSTNIVVGDLTSAELKEIDDVKAGKDVVTKTERDIELHVSKNAKVTIRNPYSDDMRVVYNDLTETSADYTRATPTNSDKLKDTSKSIGTAHDGVVTIQNVNLRQYHSKALQILVEAEDLDSANGQGIGHFTEYYLTFTAPGTSAKAVINSVTFHGANGLKVESKEKDKDGNIIVHIPYAKRPAGAAYTDFTTKYTKMSVDASNGATVFDCSSTKSGSDYTFGVVGHVINEDSAMTSRTDGIGTDVYVYDRADSNAKFPDDDCDFLMILDTNYAGVAGTSNAKYVYIYIDDPLKANTITKLTLTDKTTLLASDGYTYEAKINHDKKTIRIEVPFDFNMEDRVWQGDVNMYVYDWTINGTHMRWDQENGGNDGGIKSSAFSFDFDHVDNQINNADIGTLDANNGDPNANGVRTNLLAFTLNEDNITTVAKESSYNTNNGVLINIWSEADVAKSSTDTQAEYADKSNSYRIYAVRQPANSESKLNSVTASAPVKVELDTKVAKLNRYIITVPENYNSTTGINDAKEFELTFNRSEKSTVENIQNTWVAKDKSSAKFKVVDGELYFDNAKVEVTNDRVIHFTIRAEDGTSTGAYEFLIKEGEASSDATLSSVAVDDETSFTKDGNNYIVRDLTEDERYDVTKLPVVITTTDPGATVTVDGKEYKYDLSTGSNITVDLSEGKTATVVVTAADEVTTATYTLSMRQGEEPGSDPADSYTDLDKVPSGMRETVRKAINLGLMSNTGKEGIFDPKANVSRKDFAVIIARADLMATDAEIEDSKMADAALAEIADDSIFDDLGGLNDIQKGAVAYCKEKGYISGNGKGGFEPNKGLSRQEATVILAQWRGLTIDKTNTENSNDVPDWDKADNWAKPYINAVLENKLMSGKDFGFDPQGSVNREQTAVMLVNVFDQKYPEFE